MSCFLSFVSAFATTFLNILSILEFRHPPWYNDIIVVNYSLGVVIERGFDNMTNYMPIDYEGLLDELLEHYLEPEYYLATKAPAKCVVDQTIATTLDEYIMLLSEGYINAELCEELDPYLDALLENVWFHQWPLVRLVYVERALKRKSEIDWKKKKPRDENIDYELEQLSLLAKDGWPNAIAEVAVNPYCSKTPEDSGECYICMWIYASRKGYRRARGYLYSLTVHNEYKKFREELQLFILEEATSWFLEYCQTTEADYKKTLLGDLLTKANRLCKTRDKLRAQVSQKTQLRETAGKLFWSKEESPYEIKY